MPNSGLNQVGRTFALEGLGADNAIVVHLPHDAAAVRSAQQHAGICEQGCESGQHAQGQHRASRMQGLARARRAELVTSPLTKDPLHRAGSMQVKVHHIALATAGQLVAVECNGVEQRGPLCLVQRVDPHHLQGAHSVRQGVRYA